MCIHETVWFKWYKHYSFYAHIFTLCIVFREESNKLLLYKLHKQVFVEYIREGDAQKALSYGREILISEGEENVSMSGDIYHALSKYNIKCNINRWSF